MSTKLWSWRLWLRVYLTRAANDHPVIYHSRIDGLLMAE